MRKIGNTTAFKRQQWLVLAAVMILGFAVIVPIMVGHRATRMGKAEVNSLARRAAIAQKYAQLPLAFEPNVGQFSPEAKFFARASGYSLFLTPDEAVFVMKGSSRSDARRNFEGVLRMQFAGRSGDSEMQPLGLLPGKTNYLRGSRPENWHTNIPNYSEVAEHRVYPGVDVVYYGTERQLEYDFLVKPGADSGSIRLHFEGATDLRVDSTGDLVATVPTGEVRLKKPVAYQATDAGRAVVAANYLLTDPQTVTFSLGNYDRERPLTIDPILEYSTYLGGSNIDGANGIAVAPDGTAFVAGGTFSSDFPTAHPLQPNHGGPDDFAKDAFVSKLSADGSTLLYSTYLGGSNEDVANGIAVDTFGDAYVIGTTLSADFPVTPGSFNTLCGGDGKCGASWNPNGLIVSNGFVSKLNPEGSGLVYSAYMGYYEIVTGQSIAVDSAENAYITGQTGPNLPVTTIISASTVPPPPFPVTANAYQSTFVGGDTDAYVTKISASGSSILYSTYLGGTSEDIGYGIAVDSSANVYVTGLTYSTDFPVLGAYQAANGGAGDAFLAKINTNAATGPASLVYSTYLGGTGLDQGNAVAVDSTGNAYVAGTTSSTGLPSPAAYGGNGDAFVAKFNPSTTGAASLVYFTYLGGSLADAGNGIAVDSSGSAYVTGSTTSTNFPVAGAVFQAQYGGGNADAFVTKLDPTGTILDYSSYLGGSNTDIGYAIAVDTSGSAYVAGQTCSPDFPLANPEQATYGGNCDAFISKVSILQGLILTPGGLTFPSLNVGSTSLPETVTLTNGDNPQTISSIAITGPGASSFAQTNNCGTSLAAGAQCTFNVTFTPTSNGIQKASLTITDSAPGSPQVVSLTGSTSSALLSASSLQFGTQSIGVASAPQPITLTNIGSTPITVTSVTASDAFSATNNCTAAPIQPSTNCTINVVFTPVAAGATTGALAINDNLPDSPQVVLLNGTGLQPDFTMATSPTSASVVAGGSTSFTVNVSSISGFAQAIALACSGIPRATTCSVSPTSVTPAANGSTTATVTIATTVRSALPPVPGIRTWPPRPFLPATIAGCLLLLVLLLSVLRQPRQAWTAALGLLLFTALLIGACNGGSPAGVPPGTPAGSYQIVVTGASSSVSHTTSFSLQVH